MTVKKVLGIYLICLSGWTVITLCRYLGTIFGGPDGSYFVALHVAVPTMFSLTLESMYQRYAFFLITRVDRKRLALFRLAVLYTHFFVFALLDLLLLLEGDEVFAFAYTALGLNLFCSAVCVAARAAGDENKVFNVFRNVAVFGVALSFFEHYLYTNPLWSLTRQTLIVSMGIILSVGILCAVAAGIAFYRRRNRLSYA